jgi:hypothetical protein
MKLEFVERFSKNPQISNLKKIRPEISLFGHNENDGPPSQVAESSTRHLSSLCNAHVFRKYRPGIPALTPVIVYLKIK